MIVYQNEKFSDNVSHGFFGKKGGVSEGIFTSLNVGLGSQDNPVHVAENRQRVAHVIGSEALTSLYQIHSADCLYIKNQECGDERPKADAMVTDQPNIALTILTADCGPVLFEGRKDDGTPVIGAAHAGWGGAFKGVLEATVEKMVSVGAALSSIHACVGPCIGQASYEVGEEFYDRFIEQHSDNASFFKKIDKWHFDLPAYCAHKLRSVGVENVDLSGVDTYAEEDQCFSYRRKTHRNEDDYGRQASVIMIKS